MVGLDWDMERRLGWGIFTFTSDVLDTRGRSMLDIWLGWFRRFSKRCI
jgi:hypothetical protein